MPAFSDAFSDAFDLDAETMTDAYSTWWKYTIGSPDFSTQRTARSGSAWDTEDPEKPFALFDSDATRDLPLDWATWLLDIGSTYASHSISTHADLQCVQSAQADGVIKARITKAVAGTLVLNQKYWVTCHIVAANGEEEDQTLWLKIRMK